MKKVLLFLIDSMIPDVMERTIARGQAPALQFFLKHGQYISDCATVFPTMTASIDCSLITGTYPDEHKVPGLVWYDPRDKKIVNYINGTVPVATIGIGHCAHNVMYDMNERHLSKDIRTIHEDLEEMGYTSGSINVIAHRGHKKHKVHVPFLVNALSGFRLDKKISGPTILSLGAMIKPDIFRPINWNWSHSIASAYGVNDMYAIDVLIEVVKSGKQPHFTLIYLPDNDHKLHRTPSQAEDHLHDVDKQLARFLDSYPSWNQVLEENVVILISDHGQTVVGTSEEHNINLDKILSPFQVSKLGSAVKPNDEVIICNNERMCYIYPLSIEVQPKLIDALCTNQHIDVIAWKENDWVKVKTGKGHTLLSFQKGGPRKDCYGASWTIEGDYSILDLRINQQSVINFHNYPDALSRLYGSLFSQDIPVIVVNAVPAHEFLSEATPTHLGGGSHGSLHKTDSLVPLIIAGAKHPYSKPPRLVDIKSFVIQEIMLQQTQPTPV